MGLSDRFGLPQVARVLEFGIFAQKCWSGQWTDSRGDGCAVFALEKFGISVEDGYMKHRLSVYLGS